MPRRWWKNGLNVSIAGTSGLATASKPSGIASPSTARKMSRPRWRLAVF